MNQSRDESKKKYPESIWVKVGRQWEICLVIFASPYILGPLIACVAALYLANYQVTDESFSLFLNIIAALLASVVGGGIWDTFKNIMGNTVLIKKGDSAVRNLSLARLKVKNISDRAKKTASSEEIINLLGLLEKDVANSLQEWNDILPGGVANVEVVYGLLAEREGELNAAIQGKEELDKRLAQEAQEKQLQDGKKQELQEEIDRAKKRVLELNQEISRLQRQAVTPQGYSGPTGPGAYTFPPARRLGKVCSKCGTMYHTANYLVDKGLCPDCDK